MFDVSGFSGASPRCVRDTQNHSTVILSPTPSKADFLAMADDEDVEHANVMAAFLQWDTNGILASSEFRVQGLGFRF